MLIASTLTWLAFGCGGANSDVPSENTAAAHTTVRIGELAIRAELARTSEERARGLSDRDSLAQDGGMLFVFDEERVPGFTMRGMRFPLDFIWISADRRVVDVTEDVPAPAAPGDELSGIRPAEPVLYVLEVNGGAVREAGIGVGDDVVFEPQQ